LTGAWHFDRDPLAALREGDAGLYEAFVHSHAPTLIGFFRRLGADREESEDLAQDVFLKLYRSASTYEPRCAFPAFVLRVARNAWIDRRRRRAAEPRALSFFEPLPDGEVVDRVGAGGGEAERRASVREEGARLAAAIGALPELHASAFELAVVQGLPYSQVAEILSIPVGTVKSRVFHAVRKLRAALEGAAEGGADPRRGEPGSKEAAR
jgi:RNA polymerase sigma-70 factor (ECF subfamily)